jgi:hypothetical protein
VKPKSKTSLRNQTFVKLVPTYYHCAKIGHIKPNCFQLKLQRPWDKKVMFVPSSCGKVKEATIKPYVTRPT